MLVLWFRRPPLWIVSAMPYLPGGHMIAGKRKDGGKNVLLYIATWRPSEYLWKSFWKKHFPSLWMEENSFSCVAFCVLWQAWNQMITLGISLFYNNPFWSLVTEDSRITEPNNSLYSACSSTSSFAGCTVWSVRIIPVSYTHLTLPTTILV